jgi:hypothetical protein
MVAIFLAKVRRAISGLMPLVNKLLVINKRSWIACAISVTFRRPEVADPRSLDEMFDFD